MAKKNSKRKGEGGRVDSRSRGGNGEGRSSNLVALVVVVVVVDDDVGMGIRSFGVDFHRHVQNILKLFVLSRGHFGEMGVDDGGLSEGGG